MEVPPVKPIQPETPLPLVSSEYDSLSFLKEEINENSLEKHFPGKQYMGPGTHVFNRIKNGVLPVDYMDAVSMMHDINYLRYTGDQRIIDRADLLAIRDSDKSFAALILQMGLATKNKLGLTFDSPLPNKTIEETNYIGWRLQDYVLHNPAYQQQFQILGFNPNRHVIKDYDF